MMRTMIAAAVLAAGTLAGPARADAVSDWAELQTAIIEAGRDPMAPYDPGTMAAPGRLALAVFEAANAVDPRYRSYLGIAPAPRGTPMAAVVGGAARAVLLKIYPAQKAMIEDQLTLQLADLPDDKARAEALALGEAIAARALARSGWDDKAAMQYYRPTGSAGRWAPSHVPFPPELSAGRPWFLARIDQFRIAEPPPLASDQWARSFAEVKRMGARDSKARTPAETLKAKFWAFYELDSILRTIAGQPGRSLVQNARMYALFAMAADDLDLVMAEGKMHHMFWRPINAIRTADGDGNAATETDPARVPLLNTPNQPEYPCGHCMFANLTATILAAEGPPPPGGFAFTSERMPGIRITVPDMATYAREVSYSRILAGVHFRMTNEISDKLGHDVARYAMERFAPSL